MHALKCRNGHLCYSAAERPNGSCPECGDESFQLVVVKEEAESAKSETTVIGDGTSVVAIHTKRGTGYVKVERNTTGYSEVTTEAGAKYLVQNDSVEYLE